MCCGIVGVPFECTWPTTEVGVAEISDEFMQQRLTQAREYTLVLLWADDAYGADGADAIVWEHGRRNMSMLVDGLLPIVCPVADDTKLCGIGIFDATAERTRELMDADPGVRAGVFSYELHPVRGFPGSALPGAEAETAVAQRMFFSMHTLDGDPDQLLAAKREHMDPVVARLAPGHGAVASVTVPGEASITTYNIWRTREGAAAFTQEPEARQAQQASGLPAPSSFLAHPDAEVTLYPPTDR
jgi:hypothetical protein